MRSFGCGKPIITSLIELSGRSGEGPAEGDGGQLGVDLRTMRRRLGMPLLLVESSLDTPEICGLSNVLALLDDDVAEHAAPSATRITAKAAPLGLSFPESTLAKGLLQACRRPRDYSFGNSLTGNTSLTICRSAFGQCGSHIWRHSSLGMMW